MNILKPSSSFDDPTFGHEEPPHDCDFPSNHNHDNSIGLRKKPQGFQIDPNFDHNNNHNNNQSDKKKNERNLDSLSNNNNNNNLLQASAKPSSNKNQSTERFFTPGHSYKPPKETGFEDEYAGPAMQLVRVYTS